MTAQSITSSVSRETTDRLNQLVGLITKWNPAINLVSRASLRNLWPRHIEDSAQLFGIGGRCDHWLDLGSGGGLPGLVIALIADEMAPDMRVTLVEADARKAAFLREASRTLGISPTILPHRIEDLPPLNGDVISARALAPLDLLLTYCERHLKADGRAVFPKGRSYAEEVEAALENWRFSLQEHPSRTDPESMVLCIEGVARV